MYENPGGGGRAPLPTPIVTTDYTSDRWGCSGVARNCIVVTLPKKISGLEYRVRLLFNFTPVSVR